MEIKPVNFIEGKFYENAVFVNLEAASDYNSNFNQTSYLYNFLCLSFVFRFKFFKAAFNQIYAFN